MEKRTLRWALLFTAALLVPTGRAPATEIAQRQAIAGNAAQHLRAREFDALDALGERYRDPAQRTSSGTWMLSAFYAGIAREIGTQAGDTAHWQEVRDDLDAWAGRFPDSPTAHLARAQWLLNRAISFRDTGYAATVAPQDWAPFRDYTEQAHAYLLAHKHVAARDPRWYELMEIVAMRQQWPIAEFRRVFDEGISRHHTYYPLYFTAVSFLSPKWGGSARDIEDFAQLAVRKTRDTEGAGMYARIYWVASQEQYGAALFRDSLVDWRLLDQGMDDVLERYPDEWNIQNFAFFSCLHGDKAKTAALMSRMQEAPYLDAWLSGARYAECWNWAHAAP